MYIKVNVRLREVLPQLTNTEVRVWFSIGMRVNGEGICWPSVDTLAREAQRSDRIVRQAIRNLENMALIGVQRRGGRGRPNIYKTSYFTYGKGENTEMKFTESSFTEMGMQNFNEIGRTVEGGRGGGKPLEEKTNIEEYQQESIKFQEYPSINRNRNRKRRPESDPDEYYRRYAHLIKPK